jgi:hypothetical protein
VIAPRGWDKEAMIRLVCPALLLTLGVSIAAETAQAEPCRPPAKTARVADRAADCARREKFVPYEPEPARSRGGFLDLGNGTEVRVGGRVQMDYDTRR